MNKLSVLYTHTCTQSTYSAPILSSPNLDEFCTAEAHIPFSWKPSMVKERSSQSRCRPFFALLFFSFILLDVRERERESMCNFVYMKQGLVCLVHIVHTAAAQGMFRDDATSMTGTGTGGEACACACALSCAPSPTLQPSFPLFWTDAAHGIFG